MTLLNDSYVSLLFFVGVRENIRRLNGRGTYVSYAVVKVFKQVGLVLRSQGRTALSPGVVDAKT